MCHRQLTIQLDSAEVSVRFPALAWELPYAAGMAELKKREKRPIGLPIFFFFSRAAGVAYGSSQARGRIGAVDAGLHHSHCNAISDQCL